MGNKNPWILGLIILCFFTYYAWNGFTLPTVFFGETIKKEAVVYETKFRMGKLGKGWKQTIRYFYFVDGERYAGKYSLRGKQKHQKVGNKISLTVSVLNPEKHKVRAFYKYERFYYKTDRKFYVPQSVGYNNLFLDKDVFQIENFSIQNDSISKIFGQVEHFNDTTIVLEPIVFYYRTKTHFSYKIINKIDSKKYLQNSKYFYRDGMSVLTNGIEEYWN